tara:strand:+ start:190 stop:1725 length:1536 start_codon:yes stop_codon:yes gene_type:complete
LIIKLKKLLQDKFFLSLIILFLFGVLSSYSLPPYNFVIINFIIYPFVFIFLYIFKGQGYRTFLSGIIFGFGYFVSNLYWITNSLKFDIEFKPLIPFALIMIPLFLSLFYGFVFFIISFFKISFNFSSLLLIAIVFSAMEFLRGTIFTGFPWNLIVYSLSNSDSSIQILSYIGTYSLNLLSITFFLLPTLIIFNISKIAKLIIIFLSISTILINFNYGQKRIENFKKTEEIHMETSIKIVSPGIKLERYFNDEDPLKKINEIIALSSPDKEKSTLFVYPEGILAGLHLDDFKKYQYLIDRSFSDNHKIIMGINILEDEKIFNTLVMFNNKLKIIHTYKKNKLVPFGEFLPFENYLSNLGLKKITQGYRSFSSSNNRELINFNKFKILPLICYEIIYSGRLSKNRNYDFIVNISEDGWFGKSVGPYQHFIHSKFRSIEEGKNIIRSSNNGYSGLVSPIGSFKKIIKSTSSGVVSINKITLVEKTLFSSHGNKIFFYFNLIYISLIFFLKRKEL